MMYETIVWYVGDNRWYVIEFCILCLMAQEHGCLSKAIGRSSSGSPWLMVEGLPHDDGFGTFNCVVLWKGLVFSFLRE